MRAEAAQRRAAIAKRRAAASGGGTAWKGEGREDDEEETEYSDVYEMAQGRQMEGGDHQASGESDSAEDDIPETGPAGKGGADEENGVPQRTADGSRRKQKRRRTLGATLAGDSSAGVEEVHASARDAVGFAHYVDILKRTPAPSLPERLRNGRCNLIFFNVASDPDIVKESQRDRLFAALMDLSRLLADQGTLIMAMKHYAWNREHIAGVMASANLIFEGHPIIAFYLTRRAGRIPASTRLHLPAQSSPVLIAHKSPSLVCHQRGNSSKSETRLAGDNGSPRGPCLEDIGAMMAEKHPPPSTFLAPEVAELCISRFTEPADLVLCTNGERDGLAELTVGAGRLYAAFVADKGRVDVVRQQIKDACTLSMQEGRFKLYNGLPPVYIGTNQWPIFVPERNVSEDANHELAVLIEKDDSGSRSEHERLVASKTAVKFGLEIKDSPIHGYGLFAGRDVEDRYMGMPLEGSFEIHNSP